eukprot:199202-Hanusia_phi.AAC.2
MTLQAARENGLARLEGKEYVVAHIQTNKPNKKSRNAYIKVVPSQLDSAEVHCYGGREEENSSRSTRMAKTRCRCLGTDGFEEEAGGCWSVEAGGI